MALDPISVALDLGNTLIIRIFPDLMQAANGTDTFDAGSVNILYE